MKILFVLTFIFKLLPVKPLATIYHIFQDRGYASIKVLRKIERLQCKLTQQQCNIAFLTECQHRKVTPKFLFVNSSRYYQFNNVLLQQTINEWHTSCNNLRAHVRSLLSPIYQSSSVIQWLIYQKSILKYLNMVKSKKMDILNRKLQLLTIQQRPRFYPSLINSSSIQLSAQQEHVLQWGLSQPYFTAKPNVTDLKSLFENLRFSITTNNNYSIPIDIDYVQTELTHQFCVYRNSLQHHLPKLNRPFKCLQPLIKNHDIIVVAMDKGNGCIVMDKKDYNTKMDSILKDTTKFVKLEASDKFIAHPIINYENKLQRLIRRIVKEKVNSSTYSKLYPQGGQPAKLYGLAKVHKENTPLRPVVSMVGTSQYELSKYLDNLLRPYIPNNYTLSSTYDLLEKLRNLSHTNNNYFVSFDVCSLFTNVPVNETIDTICNLVCTKHGFPYNHKDLKSLLTIANENYFEFDQQLYKQIDGISMGNPLAPLLADFFMGSLEANIFKEVKTFYPTSYFRYVDDTLCFFDDEAKIDTFLYFLNQQHPNIKFTAEKSNDATIPFLDIKLTLKDDIATTEVYRKPTFTGRLLHYRSIVPTIWKKGLIKTLIHRAYHLSSSWGVFHREILQIEEILTFNGYPKWWLTKAVKYFLDNHYNDESKKDDKPKIEPNYVVFKLLYNGKPSMTLKRNINRILRHCKISNIKICFITKRLRSVLPIKNQTSIFLRSSIVYKFQCSADPNICYIGETGRQLIRRVKDHIGTDTAITQHLRQCQSCANDCDALIERKNFSILQQTSNYLDRNIKEALMIKSYKPSLNTQLIHGKKPFCLQMF